MPRLWIQVAVLLTAMLVCAGRNCRAEGDRTLSAERAALYAEYRQKLAPLAAWCDERKLADEASAVRDWLPPRRRDKTYLFVLDPLRLASAPAAPASEVQREFRARWQKLRAEQALKLFDLAQRAAAEHQPSLAVELVTEAAREDVDFKPAWRFLGYVKYGGTWRTPFEIKQLGEGKIWDDRFGWIVKAHAAPYQKGQRFYRNRWMTIAEEARLRRNIRDGWRVETDHYVVTTNDSLEEGVSLARQLEQLYAVWQQVFAGYVTNDADLARRLATGEPVRDRESVRHQVVYFRSRDEYNQALLPSQPQIGITLGIYIDSARTAYFFAGEDQQPTTLFHEATHQLFQETRPTVKDVGREGNFWIIEAVACYMESLEERAGYFTLGGPDEGRMPAARHRLLEDDYYVPLDQLVALGVQSLQHHADIAKLYSESAGLAAFLLCQYPEATVQYLQAVYTGHAVHDTLARLTGRSYDELDQAYRGFVEGKLGTRNSELGTGK